MFCPKCKAEYRAGFTVCSDCNVRLVFRLPEEDDEPELVPADLVVVSTVQGPLEEGQIRSFLEANGIPTVIRGEAVGKTYGITIDGLGARQILVPAEFADTARDLLDRADHGELEITEY